MQNVKTSCILLLWWEIYKIVWNVNKLARVNLIAHIIVLFKVKLKPLVM